MVKKSFHYQGWKFEESFQSSVGMKFNRTSPVKMVVAEVNGIIFLVQKLSLWYCSAVAVIALPR